ncbi:MAG TPA: TerB family tellurite resistance protein [Oligoflexus sp.]|uniref:helix-turn-helix domain-containing protein n=1 Tax=Oligoflexus sp. TaxID=1971216 RepID=UPI002D4D2274|nr:TerB family tellurite resistance protein [Oligoflexus sp.]HYX36477.1 TerB family tellurite resistance protein [Oligoflexus sp.]
MGINEQFPELHVLERLIHLRKEAGLTQKLVEQKLDWRQGTLYDYEKARLKISLEAAWYLLQLYGADWKDLFEPMEVASTVEAIGPWMAPMVQLGLVSQSMQDMIQSIRHDPIIAAEIGLDELGSSTPVLQLLLNRLTETQRRDYFLELCRYVNSLMTADHKIRAEEKKARDILLAYAPFEFDEREKASLLRAFESRYLGKGLERKFPKDALKHLLLWILYIMALSDGELNHHEQAYIEAVAENIELKKSSLHFIQKQVLSFHGKEPT